MEKRVWAFASEHELIEEGQSVGVATSGGADSMALLVCLYGLAEHCGFSVVCVHFEHGIRGETSLRDAELVSGFCGERKIPFYMGAADVPALAKSWGQSVETAAKRAREEYFASLVESGEVDVIATAHHRDDNAESILMHILRGSGLSGLAGICVKKEHMVRPLLCVGREEILDYVRQNGIPYAVDETNADNSYTRNYVRNELLPAIRQNVNGQAAAALERLGLLAARDGEYLDAEAERLFGEYAGVTADGRVTMDAQTLASLHPAMAGRLVRRACRALHVVQDVELAHVEAVLRLAKAGKTGSRASLSRNLFAQVEYGTLSIGFKGREADHSFDVPFDREGVELPGGTIRCEYLARGLVRFGQGRYDECLDADRLPALLRVRTRREGDMIRPLGAPGAKKLKDYFIDKKLPREERARVPLLADGKNIVWAVGHTISEDYRVREDTKRVLRLKYCGNGEGEV